MLMETQTGSRWSRLISSSSLDSDSGGGGGVGVASNTSLFMTQAEKRQCVLIGCYYLVNNMSSDKSDNDNLEIFLNNLTKWMVTDETNEDYVNDGNGVTLKKINEMLRNKWKDWKALISDAVAEEAEATKETQDLDNEDFLRVKRAQDLTAFLFGNVEVVVLDDDGEHDEEDSKEKKETEKEKETEQEEEAELDVCLQSSAFRVGCFMRFFYSIKDLDKDNNKSDISSVATTSGNKTKLKLVLKWFLV